MAASTTLARVILKRYHLKDVERSRYIRLLQEYETALAEYERHIRERRAPASDREIVDGIGDMLRKAKVEGKAIVELPPEMPSPEIQKLNSWTTKTGSMP